VREGVDRVIQVRYDEERGTSVVEQEDLDGVDEPGPARAPRGGGALRLVPAREADEREAVG